MDTLNDFVNRHFFSKRAARLVNFLTEHHLVDITELVIEQIHQIPQPTLFTIAKRVYSSYKSKLRTISNEHEHEELEELLKEFSLRLMGEYYEFSTLTPNEFIQELQISFKVAAQELGLNPDTIDADMEWDKIKMSLKYIRRSGIRERNSNRSTHSKLIWNEEAEFKILTKVLVHDYKVIDNEDAMLCLFDVKRVTRVNCDPNRIHFLVYLFRYLCPLKKDDELLDGRIVSTDPQRKLWDALAIRLIKNDGSVWSEKTLRNYCSEVHTEDKYIQMRSEVSLIVQRLRKSAGAD